MFHRGKTSKSPSLSDRQRRLVMSRSFLFMQVAILLCFSPSFLGAAIAVQHGNETDLQALLAFKAKITDDPLGFMSLWNESVHFCQWPGVRCGHRHQRVTELDLFSRKLAGSISPHIGNLSFLIRVRLSNNSFSQEIPPEFGRLPRLRKLAMVGNLLSGEIPSNLSGCSNLIGFDLSTNMLSGEIPVELGSLSNLQGIYLNENNLKGSVPSAFGNLSSLQVISVAYNNIGGSIPNALGRLANLTVFAFSSNNLTGTIPPTILNLSSVTTFDVTNNYIQGSLPFDLGNTLPNLDFLGIGMNQFTGTIPASMSNSSQLEVFVAGANKLHGKVPSFEKLQKLEWLSIYDNYLGSDEADGLSFISSLTNASNLQLLDLLNNNFTGELPETIGNLSTTLQYLAITGNQVFGTITTGILNLVNLQRLQLGRNQFTGEVPIDIGKLQKLRQLELFGNKLSGYIPYSIANLSLLNQLTLGGNSLHGGIPPDLGKCQNLLLLDLSHNNLTGPIPPQVFGLSSLSLYLDLSHNQLTGSFPTTVENLKNLGKLDISNNLLFGEIPSSLGSCIMLELLYMNNNRFQGTIPSLLSSLTGLQFLDLSLNNFSGQIPEYLEGFALQYLNLSFNNFEGEVPTKGVFKNASATSVLGNRMLCGGVPELHLPTCDLKEVKKMGSNILLKMILSITLGFLGLSMVLGFLLLRCRRMRRRKPSTTSLGYSLLKVSYQDLLKATDGFSSANLVGLGSFGSVYKGLLDDGKTIAVKVLNTQRRGACKSFIAECEALRNIRHRNLVKLLTACSGIDYHGNDFKALLYEFMVNGSLEEWLHPIQQENEVNEEPRHLDLLQRLNIAIDIAIALDYLHNECETPVVHCDLKPSNVLLNSEMTEHVGDFGLARLLLQGTNNLLENQASSIGIRGSVGYAPPEYGMGSEVSTKGDVYSYGILLLELFTGKRPTNDRFSESLNLHNFVKMAFHEQVVEITDSKLLQQGETGETSTNNTQNQCHITSQKIRECLISVFGIALACSADSSRERMDIRDVAAQLCMIRVTFLRAAGGGIPERTAAITIQSSLGTRGLITPEQVDSAAKPTMFYTA